VAARSKAWVCGRSLAGIVDSNPGEGMDVCLLWVLCVVTQRSLRRADHSSRGVLPTVCDLETSTMRRPRPEFGCCATGKETNGNWREVQIMTFLIIQFYSPSRHWFLSASNINCCTVNTQDSEISMLVTVIRVIMGCSYRESRRDLYNELNIPFLKSQYILSLMMFVIKNKEYFVKNNDCYGLYTRQNTNLHTSQVNLTIYHTGVKV
jgi:hypothetical protein